MRAALSSAIASRRGSDPSGTTEPKVRMGSGRRGEGLESAHKGRVNPALDSGRVGTFSVGGKNSDQRELQQDR